MHNTNSNKITEAEFYSRAFSRNIGLLTQEEQNRLKKIRVGIPGLGGVGGIHLVTLARTGIGGFSLADFDRFEVENFNRQAGAFIDSVNKEKLETMYEEVLRINPFLEIRKFEKGITDSNIDDFLKDLDVVVDSLDFFAIDVKCKLYDRALEKGIHVVSAGPVAFGCSQLIFAPFQGMSFSEYFDFKPNDTETLKQVKYGLGLTPNIQFLKTFIKSDKLSLQNRQTPSLGLSCQMSAAMATCAVLKIVLNRGGYKVAPSYERFDPYLNKHYLSRNFGGNRNIFNRVKLYFAHKKFASQQSAKVNTPTPESNANNLQSVIQTDGSISSAGVEYLLSKAVLAPSGDNTQHWKFTVDGNKLSIFCDAKRAEFAYSIGGLAEFVSYGAVVENIVIAAAKIHLNAQVKFCATSENSDLIAEITLSASDSASDELADFIDMRHTNRNKFQSRPLSPKHIAELSSASMLSSKVTSHIFNSKTDRKCLAKIAFHGDRILWETEMLHADLFRWIRFNNKENDGLLFGSLGLDPHEVPIFPLMSFWKFVQVMNKVGLSKMAAFKSYLLMRGSPLHLVLTVKNRSIADYFEAGRSLERIWITANSLGLSVQPMTSAVMTLHHHLSGLQEGFSESVLKNLPELAKSWADLLKDKTEFPVMLLRIGYSKQVKVRTKRRPVSEFKQ